MTAGYVIGAAMVPFGRYPDRSAAALGREAILSVLADSNVPRERIHAVYAGRSFAGAIDGQVSVPAQVALRGTGIGDVPVVNFDNACAAVPSALHFALAAVRTGTHDLVLVAGMDKLYATQRRASMAALVGAMDVDEMRWMLDPEILNGSVFMEHYYGRVARTYLERVGGSAADLAAVAVKNRGHASLNPFAQYREPLTIEAVLGAPMVADPLTKLMCSPLTDGATAMLVCSDAFRRGWNGAPAVRIAASAIRSGQPDRDADMKPVIARTAEQAYEEAGLGPKDLDLVEVHEASAAGELIASEELGLCGEREGVALLRDGASRLGGRVPINVSGGLLSRGHPGAATGGAQLVELVWQLQGRASGRQVENARVGLAQSSGGLIGMEAACTAITILARDD